MTVTSASPASGETGVVLGRTIELVFDQNIDVSSVTSASFLLRGPGQTSLVDADETIRSGTKPVMSSDGVAGTFSFPAPNKLVFTTSVPLRPNVEYTVLVVGQGSLLASTYVKATDGTPLAKSYQYKFKTGELEVQPIVSPVDPVASWEKPRLDASAIIVRALPTLDGSQSRSVELRFPGPINVASFNAMKDQIIVALEPLLNDPNTVIPDGIVTTVSLSSPSVMLFTLEVQ